MKMSVRQNTPNKNEFLVLFNPRQMERLEEYQKEEEWDTLSEAFEAFLENTLSR